MKDFVVVMKSGRLTVLEASKLSYKDGKYADGGKILKHYFRGSQERATEYCNTCFGLAAILRNKKDHTILAALMVDNTSMNVFVEMKDYVVSSVTATISSKFMEEDFEEITSDKVNFKKFQSTIASALQTMTQFWVQKRVSFIQPPSRDRFTVFAAPSVGRKTTVRILREWGYNVFDTEEYMDAVYERSLKRLFPDFSKFADLSNEHFLTLLEEVKSAIPNGYIVFTSIHDIPVDVAFTRQRAVAEKILGSSDIRLMSPRFGAEFLTPTGCEITTLVATKYIEASEIIALLGSDENFFKSKK